MQNTWVYKRIEYVKSGGFLAHIGTDPNEEQLRMALDEIVASANNGGWTVSALMYLPHERTQATMGPLISGVTIVATLSRP